MIAKLLLIAFLIAGASAVPLPTNGSWTEGSLDDPYMISLNQTQYFDIQINIKVSPTSYFFIGVLQDGSSNVPTYNLDPEAEYQTIRVDSQCPIQGIKFICNSNDVTFDFRVIQVGSNLQSFGTTFTIQPSLAGVATFVIDQPCFNFSLLVTSAATPSFRLLTFECYSGCSTDLNKNLAEHQCFTDESPSLCGLTGVKSYGKTVLKYACAAPGTYVYATSIPLYNATVSSVASYSDDSSCPNGCSGQGACYQGACYCYEPFAGADCKSLDSNQINGSLNFNSTTTTTNFNVEGSLIRSFKAGNATKNDALIVHINSTSPIDIRALSYNLLTPLGDYYAYYSETEVTFQIPPPQSQNSFLFLFGRYADVTITFRLVNVLLAVPSTISITVLESTDSYYLIKAPISPSFQAIVTGEMSRTRLYLAAAVFGVSTDSDYTLSNSSSSGVTILSGYDFGIRNYTGDYLLKVNSNVDKNVTLTVNNNYPVKVVPYEEYGDYNSCLNNCSNIGECDQNNNCICPTGFTGKDCSTPVCFDLSLPNICGLSGSFAVHPIIEYYYGITLPNFTSICTPSTLLDYFGNNNYPISYYQQIVGGKCAASSLALLCNYYLLPCKGNQLTLPCADICTAADADCPILYPSGLTCNDSYALYPVLSENFKLFNTTVASCAPSTTGRMTTASSVTSGTTKGTTGKTTGTTTGTNSNGEVSSSSVLIVSLVTVVIAMMI